MAARFPSAPASQPELMAIAREIPAHTIDILATSYLDIDPLAELPNIKHGAGYDGILTNFKCLHRWCCNTTEPDARQVLFDRLTKAAKEGLITHKGVEVLRQPEQLKETSKGENYPILIVIGGGDVDTLPYFKAILMGPPLVVTYTWLMCLSYLREGKVSTLFPT